MNGIKFQIWGLTKMHCRVRGTATFRRTAFGRMTLGRGRFVAALGVAKVTPAIVSNLTVPLKSNLGVEQTGLRTVANFIKRFSM